MKQHLLLKHSFLLIARAEVTVEIQTAFPHSHAPRVANKLSQLPCRLTVPMLGIMGVHLQIHLILHYQSI